MTENEARLRWCPLSRVEGDKTDPTAGNRDRVATHESARCVGSACALWKWSTLNVFRKTPTGRCGLT